MNASALQKKPMDVYVMEISYFSGKFEAFLRYKEIPYNRIVVDHPHLFEVYKRTGTMKVPAVHTHDDLWLKDTTPMLAWFDERHPEGPIYPSDPALTFLGHLLEDFGDEWLWRPAMWWRWEPVVSRHLLADRISREVLAGFPAPKWLLRPYFAWRQRRTWLWGDGMTRQNTHQVRDIYTNMLDALQQILHTQPFLLGHQPSNADFGFFGPFFRHFSHDPDPAEIMRQRGPAVYAWCANLWNARASQSPKEPVWNWPSSEAWHPIWKEVMGAYLPYFSQNARAWQQGKSRFDFCAGGYEFKGTITTQYRVWCRQQLQRRWDALSQVEQSRVLEVLQPFGDITPLTEAPEIDSGLDQDLALPFSPKPPTSLLDQLSTWALGTPRNIRNQQKAKRP